MNKIYTLVFLFLALGLQAQDRYLDAEFAVNVATNVTYGNNISILTGAPAAQDLVMDVYTPAGDTETARPLMLVAHTGSFLPPLFNGGITGAKSDSTTVNICKQLASRGYVVAAFTYRAGWLPTATDQDTRTSTLLQAAYRGIQDSRSCVRFFRKSAAEDGNPYGIDPAKIGMVGVGTGSYIAYGAGSLYDFEEVLLGKFINQTTLEPYIDSLVYGNLYGDTQAALCLPNTPGYSSEIDFAFALGGALGDASWIDGEAREAAFSGVHCTQDIFAPYGDGPVIVPTTMEFVVNVSGNRTAIQYANAAGNNDILNDASIQLSYEAEIETQSNIDVMPALSAPIKMGVEHFYGFNLAFPQGSPWSWWDLPTLEAVVAATNAALGTSFVAADLHASGLQTNPDMSQAKGLAYVDTCMTLMLPRACLALNLECNLPVNTKEIQAIEVGLSIYPNPVETDFIISINEDVKMSSVYVFSIDGKLVQAHVAVNNSKISLQRNGLQSGIYVAQITTDKGTVSKEIVFK